MAEFRPPVGRIRTLEDLLKRAETGGGEVKLHFVIAGAGTLQSREVVTQVSKHRDGDDPIIAMTVQRCWPTAGRPDVRKIYASQIGLTDDTSHQNFLFPTRSGADMYAASLRKAPGTPSAKHYALEDETV